MAPFHFYNIIKKKYANSNRDFKKFRLPMHGRLLFIVRRCER